MRGKRFRCRVHPPADKAAALKGEPKTEAWYVAQAEPGSEIVRGTQTGRHAPGIREQDQSRDRGRLFTSDQSQNR